MENSNMLQLEHQIVKPQQSAAASKGFADVLKGELDKNDGVKFSKHAMERIQSRGVDMSQQTLASLNRAVTKARAKGCKAIAVIGEANAFIVSVQNNTVIPKIFLPISTALYCYKSRTGNGSLRAACEGQARNIQQDLLIYRKEV